MLPHKEIFSLLEETHNRYNSIEFIETDPISIPHRFRNKEDIEIAAFITATIAWGQRKTIINNANRLMQLMDEAPHSFVMDASKAELKTLEKFVHRTFNGTDCIYFVKALRNIYKKHGGLESAFRLSRLTPIPSPKGEGNEYVKDGISNFREIFFEIPHPARTRKHISNPMENSSAKRINMFLRWMVRKDKRGVDFGIWKASPSILYCPLDVHSGNTARELKLLHRTQNDWKAVEELTARLRDFDANDPVKYDFSLFGIGAFGEFRK